MIFYTLFQISSDNFEYIDTKLSKISYSIKTKDYYEINVVYMFSGKVKEVSAVFLNLFRNTRLITGAKDRVAYV